MEIQHNTKLMQFRPLCCKSEAILCKKFRPGHQGWSVQINTFHPGYRDLGSHGNRASPASHINTSKFLRRAKRRGEISEIKPARLTGLIWRGPKYLLRLMRIKPFKWLFSFGFENLMMSRAQTTQSKVKPKLIVIRMHMFSRVSRQLCVFTFRFDWFTGMSV